MREYIWQQPDTFSHRGTWHWRCDIEGCIASGQAALRSFAQELRDAHVFVWHAELTD